VMIICARSVLSIELHLHTDELVQQLQIGQTVVVIGVPVLDTSRKVVTVEARPLTNAMCSTLLMVV